MSNFKIGDTVRLKSGGPLVTVTAFKVQDDGPKVWTTYFIDKNEEKRGFYPAGAVEHDDGMPPMGGDED